jgi:hypothetical protein
MVSGQSWVVVRNPRYGLYFTTNHSQFATHDSPGAFHVR